MTDSQKDIWSQWMLNRRFGGDPERMKMMLDFLYALRDKMLSHIHLKEKETLLDVGGGDGLIAFGAPLRSGIFVGDEISKSEPL